MIWRVLREYLVGFGVLTGALLGLATSAGAVTQELDVTVTIGSAFQVPGPSQALFNAPYYTCTRNFYVATNGSDSNDGTAPTTGGGHGPWLTMRHADTASRAGGDCINVLPGTYANGVLALHGGSSATSTGYVVYRCTTMLGCIVTTNFRGLGVWVSAGRVGTNYVMFDGFELAASNSTTAYATGLLAGEFNAAATTMCCHHIWFFNMKVHGYSQAGFGGGLSDFIYVVHSEFYNNASGTGAACTGIQGSGISEYEPTLLTGYTYTADDKNNPVLGNMAYSGDYFRIVFAWNHVHNNFINNACTGFNHTDGNGIIFDDFASRQGGNGGVVYAGHALAMFNIVYNNGGYGIHVFSQENHGRGTCTPGAGIVIANNSTYNNSLDVTNLRTQGWRYDIGENTAGCTLFVNNIAFPISPSQAYPNVNYMSASPDTNNGGWSNFITNVGYCIGATCSNPDHRVNVNQGHGIWTDGKDLANPTWTNVGNASVGNETTQPNGINFVPLAGSPAIGFMTTETFLPANTRDAGACDHSLATCP